jgi:pimeloyl-ACP methyl ester carboxylesterase
MTEIELQAGQFQLRAFDRIDPGATHLSVFLEGDGRPWTRRGTRIAVEPTTHNPLALRLAIATPGAVLYLGRPCYLGHAGDDGCKPELWTSGRYSDTVVSAMAEALRAYVSAHELRTVTLVGHSGGGTLAVLIASRVAAVTQVITLAANLDIVAWAHLHGYLPLDSSLNPSELPPLAPHIRELHLLGARDLDVPAQTASRYLDRISPSAVMTFDEYDHACCWERDWKRIWTHAQEQLAK